MLYRKIKNIGVKPIAILVAKKACEMNFEIEAIKVCSCVCKLLKGPRDYTRRVSDIEIL